MAGDVASLGVAAIQHDRIQTFFVKSSDFKMMTLRKNANIFLKNLLSDEVKQICIYLLHQFAKHNLMIACLKLLVF